MVVKINNKPIRVEQRDDDDIPWYKEMDWTYTGVSTFGYATCIWIMDYAAYIFAGYHPFPWITWVGKIFQFMGGLL